MNAGDQPSTDRFVEYYEAQSRSPETAQRTKALMDLVLRIRREAGLSVTNLGVAEIGCGAGAHCTHWARRGFRAHGLDINEKLLAIARQRSDEQGLNIDYQLGNATELPWPSESMDVCLMPELLEHVGDWQSCLREASRVLRHGGVLCLNTTNWLCPKQQEFKLPLYSWYPSVLKRRFEILAVTTWPHLVNHAAFPAVNWFSPYQLRDYLADLDFVVLDRFDCLDLAGKAWLLRCAAGIIRTVPLVRFLAHVVTPYTFVAGIKGLRAHW